MTNFKPTDEVAFRRGYLTSMAANGITPDKLAASIEKCAILGIPATFNVADPLKVLGKAPAGLIRTLIGGTVTAADSLIAGTVLTAGALGIGGGYATYKLRKMLDNTNHLELKDVRNKEMEFALQQEILRIQQRMVRNRAKRAI